MELPRFVWGFLASHGAITYVLEARPRWSPLEMRALQVAMGVVAGSAVAATRRREVDRQRRLGTRGVKMAKAQEGIIEYRADGPITPLSSSAIVLENGLGESLESWSWISDLLAEKHLVFRYHRPGYGLSKSSVGYADALKAVLHSEAYSGPFLIATHSIGSLVAAQNLSDPELRTRCKGVVLIDGTDPDLFRDERADRKKAGRFLQSQALTLFAGLTGINAWAPNPVGRQVAFPPDEQFSYVQFAFNPRNVLNTVREYRSIDESQITTLRKLDIPLLVIGSTEYAAQQEKLANGMSAQLLVVVGSSHRNVLGHKQYATMVATHIEAFAAGVPQ